MTYKEKITSELDYMSEDAQRRILDMIRIYNTAYMEGKGKAYSEFGKHCTHKYSDGSSAVKAGTFLDVCELCKEDDMIGNLETNES